MRSGGGRIIAQVNADQPAPEQAEGEADRGRKFDLARTIALSDGVFAFALTLLVLSITVPVINGAVTSSDVVSALGDRTQEMMSWLVSFIVIGGFWVRHNELTRQLQRVDGRFLALNLAFLAIVAFIPYPTEIIGKYPTTASLAFYAAVISLLIVLGLAGSQYASTHGLLRTPETAHEKKVRIISALVPASFFLASIPVAILLGNAAGYACWIALIPADMIIGRLVGQT